MQSAALPNQYLNPQPLVDLQRRRGRFAELGSQMEQVATAVKGQRRNAPLLAAADAYRTAGDEPSELRVLSTAFSLTSLDTNRQQRFFELLTKRKPDELVRIASAWPPASGEQAANYAVAHGSAALAHAVVQARSKARPPVWNKAYNALVGMYFARVHSAGKRRVSRGVRRRPNWSPPVEACRSRSALGRKRLVLLRIAIRRVSR